MSKHIIGSKFGKILCQRSKTDALLKSVLYPTPMINKPVPMKWGIKNEKLTRSVHLKYINKQGRKGLLVEDCGFIVSQQEGYLGVSPDDQVHNPSSDQPNGILEIKCSYTKRTQTPQQVCDDPSFIVNVKTTYHYYHQVQFQLLSLLTCSVGVIFAFLPPKAVLSPE